MAKEDIVDEFNEGGVKGVMVNPSNSALERLLGNIPTKAHTSTTTTEVEEPEVIETPTEPEEVVEPPKGEVEKPKENEDKKTRQTADDNKGNSGQSNSSVSTSSSEEDSSIIDEFKQEFGDIDEQFEETTDGLKQYFSKVREAAVEEGKKDGILELFKEYPLVADLAKHLSDGYGLDSFQKKFEVFDYSKLDVKEDNIKLQEQLYREALLLKGNSEEDIEELVTAAKDNGKLLDKSKGAIKVLSDAQDKEIEKIQQREKALKQQAEAEDAATLKEVDKLLKGGSLLGIPFTKDKMDELRNFGSVVGKDGLTERDRKWNSLTIEQLLVLDSIVLNDFKTVGAKVATVGKPRNLAEIKKKVDGTAKVNMTTSSDSATKEVLKKGLKDIFESQK